MEGYECLLKFLIVGNAATGKTCLLRWFLDGKFKEQSLHTIGVEFGTKIIEVEGKSVKLQIWDTAGQERFQCVTRSYYRGAAGALVVYDVNDRDSFNAVQNWIAHVRELALPDTTIVLIGNKLDLADELRQVSESEARQCAEENGVHVFFETSAKTGTNVIEAFLSTARGILAQRPFMTRTESFPVGIGPAQLTVPTSRNSSLWSKCC